MNAFFVHHCGLESQHRKDDHWCQNGGEPVDDGYYNGILLTVVFPWVVTGETYHSSKAQSKGVKDLSGCIQPHLGIFQTVKLEEDIYLNCLQHVPFIA